MLVKTLKQNLALIFFYTLDIRNIIFNPKFCQHFLPSLIIRLQLMHCVRLRYDNARNKKLGQTYSNFRFRCLSKIFSLTLGTGC